MRGLGSLGRTVGILGRGEIGESTTTVEAASTTVILIGNDSAADGTTTFADESGLGHTPDTVNGNVQYDTADAPTGLTSSVLFDGTGDWLSWNDHSDFELGDGDFTIELFFKAASQNFQVAAKRSSAGVIAWSLFASVGPGALSFSASSDGSTADLLNGAQLVAAWSASAWRHAAVTRDGDVWRGFYNGVKGFESTVSGTIHGNAAPMTLGGRDGGTSLLNGWIASFRIKKGECLYTGDFTPPVLPLSV